MAKIERVGVELGELLGKRSVAGPVLANCGDEGGRGGDFSKKIAIGPKSGNGVGYRVT